MCSSDLSSAFTSVNGVRHFVEALDRSSRDLRALRAKLCAIGPATRAAIEELHLRVDVMPEEYVAESLVAALAGDANVMARTGSVQVAAQLGREYGFTDIDGKSPRPLALGDV